MPVSINDRYCRHCEKKFDTEAVSVMKKAMRKLTIKNFPSLILMAAFVLGVLFLLAISM